MPKLLAVRELTAAEAGAVRRLAHSRTAAARLVERARVVWLSAQGWRVPAIAAEVGCDEETARRWLRRFDAAGLDGLAALSDPQALGQPFGDWTYDRLEAYLNEVAGIPIKRSRIQEVLVGEGLRWRAQETWFGKRVDPEFAAKRGR